MRFCVLGARFPPLSGALFFLGSLLYGCAGPQTRALLSSPPVLPARVELSETPFFAQSAYQCGPAALATALSAAGIAADPDVLTGQVYVPARRGSLQVEMLAAARRNGAVAVEIKPALPALLRTIADGYPVVILQNLGPAWLPRWHYAVLIGYDLNARNVVLRSGTTYRQVMSMSTFEHTWARSGHWAIAALRPGQVPSGLPEEDYLRAAIAFEAAAGAEAALRAYEGAARRWPASRMAWLGAGNSAYRLEDWQRAEEAFGRAAELPGDPAPALNNLALTLAAQGRTIEAIAAAERAVAAGGAFETVARETLAKLRRSPQDPGEETQR
jgi:tetratricopeptide (TPR) repeat protein